MDWDAFFVVHRDLPREGPGEPADVHWALAETGLSGAIRVCDAACGPGADLVTLAEALREAQITGIEKQAHFVEAAQERTVRFGDRVQVERGDMAALNGPYDLIWCAGALYFLGVTEGLTKWRSALKPGGWVAFSEPVKLSDPMPDVVSAFWEEYPALTELDGIKQRVEAAGFEVCGHRMIIGAPWAAYFDPMDRRIAKLRAEKPSAALRDVLDLCALESAQWRAAPDQIAYALILAHPV